MKCYLLCTTGKPQYVNNCELSAVSGASLGLYVCGGLMNCGIFKDNITMSLF